jgi:hypothetical protein
VRRHLEGNRRNWEGWSVATSDEGLRRWIQSASRCGGVVERGELGLSSLVQMRSPVRVAEG